MAIPSAVPTVVGPRSWTREPAIADSGRALLGEAPFDGSHQPVAEAGGADLSPTTATRMAPPTIAVCPPTPTTSEGIRTRIRPVRTSPTPPPGSRSRSLSTRRTTSNPTEESEIWRRPSSADRIEPALTFDWADADADLANLRFTLEGPGGAAHTIELPAERVGVRGFSGTATLRPFLFDADDPLGTYTVTALPIDWSATAGTPVTWVLTLSNSAGMRGPTVTGLSPALPGETWTIEGLGFDDGSGEPPRVSLAGYGLVIEDWSDTAIDVRVPEDADAAPLQVVNARGRGRSVPLAIDAAITIRALSTSVPAGGQLRFSAAVSGSPGSAVVWLVEGVVGGTAAAGTIDMDGLYRAPASVPLGGSVTIEAELLGDDSLVGELELAIVPPPTQPGYGRILAAQGLACSRSATRPG